MAALEMKSVGAALLSPERVQSTAVWIGTILLAIWASAALTGGRRAPWFAGGIDEAFALEEDLADFPESAFACEPALRDGYHRRVARGRERMAGLSVVFCAVCRDARHVLPRLAARVERLGGLFRDYRVVLVADSPSPRLDATYRCVERNPGHYGRCDTPRAGHVGGYGTPTLRVLADRLDLPIVDLQQWICPEGPSVCPSAIGGVLVLRQGSHLTDTYVRTLTPMLHRELSRLGVAHTPVGRIGLDDVPESRH